MDFLDQEFSDITDNNNNNKNTVNEIKKDFDMNQNFVDDDDLQAALARSRNIKKRKTMKKAEDIAKEVELERQQLQQQRQQSADQNDESEESSGVFMSSTSEFVKGLSSSSSVNQKREEKIEENNQKIQGLTIASPPQKPISIEAAVVVKEEDAMDIVDEDIIRVIRSLLSSI